MGRKTSCGLTLHFLPEDEKNEGESLNECFCEKYP